MAEAYDRVIRLAVNHDDLNRLDVDMKASHLHFSFVCECGGTIKAKSKGILAIVCSGCHSYYVLYAEVSTLRVKPMDVAELRKEVAMDMISIDPVK
jgi:hypothetical protein